MEQYQYVEGFQRFHTSLKLRRVACLSLQFLSFEYLPYDIWHSFCIPNEKVSAFDNKGYLQASETQRY